MSCSATSLLSPHCHHLCLSTVAAVGYQTGNAPGYLTHDGQLRASKADEWKELTYNYSHLGVPEGQSKWIRAPYARPQSSRF